MQPVPRECRLALLPLRLYVPATPQEEGQTMFMRGAEGGGQGVVGGGQGPRARQWGAGLPGHTGRGQQAGLVL